MTKEKVSIEIEVKKIGEGLTQLTDEMKKLGKTVKGETAQIDRHFGGLKSSIGSLRNMFIALGGALILRKAITEINETVTAASNLEEATNKFNVVFQGQEEIARSWAATLVESYAMSRREAVQYLASMQDLFVPMGVAADLAGKLSFEVVKLAADLGSFNNQSTEQVMADMQSALVGNYETMKKYGVVLNEANVSQTALAMGLAKSKDELTAGQKAQAAYALIVQGSQAAIGDMTRTSGGYANQMKQLRSNTEDLKASIGEKLLPVATELLTKLNDWIKKNEELLGQEIGNWLQGIAKNLKDSLPYLKTFAQYLDSIYAISLEGQIIKTEETLRKLEADRKNLLMRIFNPIPGKVIDQEIARLKKELNSLYDQAYFQKKPKKHTNDAPDKGGSGVNTNIPTYDPAAAAKKNAEEAINKQIEALKTQAATFGMAAKEAALYKLALEGATTEQLKQAAAILDTLAAQDATKKKDADIESIQREVDALKTEAATYGMTSREITLYKLALDGATPAQLEQASAILKTLEAQDELNRKAEEGKRLIEEGKGVYESTRTETEKYAETLKKLNELLAAGAINQDTYQRAATQAAEAMEKAAGKTQTVWEGVTENIAQAFEAGVFDMFKDGVSNIEEIWKEFCNTLVESLMRALSQMAINDLLYGTIAGKGEGAATGGVMGWLGGLGKSSGGSGGGIWSGIKSIFGFAEGGWIPEPVLGKGLTSGRYYSFAERETERVMTKNDIRNINNNNSTQASNQRPTLNARIINVLDPSVVGDYLGTDAAEQIIMNIVKKNQGALAH